MSLDGPKHVPPAIEYAVALWEHATNWIHLGLIAIHHKNRWWNVWALFLDQIKEVLNHYLCATGWQHPGNQYALTNTVIRKNRLWSDNHAPWPQWSRAIRVNNRIPLYWVILWVTSMPRNTFPRHLYASFWNLVWRHRTNRSLVRFDSAGGRSCLSL